MVNRNLLVLYFGVWGILCICGVPVPKRPPGFVYREDDVSAAVPVQMEVYVDLICKDSRDAFPVIVEVAKMYGPDKLRLSTVMFPLPYHPYAYWASVVSDIDHVNGIQIFVFFNNLYAPY